jgi:DNA-binding NarL/FixJ family response regulator
MRVLLADSSQEVRSALRLHLEQEPDIVIVGEVTEAGEILAQVAMACPDVVLIDCGLPGLKAEEIVPALHSQFPHLLVIALCRRPEMRQAALAAGADAFVSKGDLPESLLATIKKAHSN